MYLSNVDLLAKCGETDTVTSKETDISGSLEAATAESLALSLNPPRSQVVVVLVLLLEEPRLYVGHYSWVHSSIGIADPSGNSVSCSVCGDSDTCNQEH